MSLDMKYVVMNDVSACAIAVSIDNSLIFGRVA